MTKLQEIEKNVLLQSKLGGERGLTNTGITVISNWLDNKRCYFNIWHLSGTGNNVIKDNDTVWIGDNKYQGKLANRIAQYVYHKFKKTFTDDEMHELADLVSTNMFGGNEIVYYDVVDKINWQPGDFQENPTSCWWGSFKRGRAEFQREMQAGEAAAIRLFRPATDREMGNPIITKWYDHFIGAARCFATVDNPEGLDIIFNGYGIELEQWKNFLVTTLGYKHITNIRDRLLLGNAYINSSSGIALYDAPELLIVASQGYTNRQFGVYPMRRCLHCNTKFRMEDYKDYCNNCFRKLFVQTYGGVWIHREDAVQIDLNHQRGAIVNITVSQEEIEKGMYKKCQRTSCNNFFTNTGSGKRLCLDHRKPVAPPPPQPQRFGTAAYLTVDWDSATSTSTTASPYRRTSRRLR